MKSAALSTLVGCFLLAAGFARLGEPAIALDRRVVRAQQVVRRDRRLPHALMPRRVRPVQVSSIRDHPRLVDRRPHRHAIAQRAKHDLSVVGEPQIEPGLRVPPGGIVVSPPTQRKFRRATVNGAATPLSAAGEITVRSLPAAIHFAP